MAVASPLDEPLVPPQDSWSGLTPWMPVRSLVGSADIERQGDLEAAEGDTAARRPGQGDAAAAGLSPLTGGLLSRLFLVWVFPLVKRASSQEQLTASDLFLLQSRCHPDAIVSEFTAKWQEGGARRDRWDGIFLLKVLMRIHLRDVGFLWLGRLIGSLASFTFPLFLNLTIRFIKDLEEPAWKGIILALSMFVVNAAVVVIQQNTTIGLGSMGIRIRASMISSIFRKLVLLRQDALVSFSTGKLNNMITTDVDSAQRVVRRLHVLVLQAPASMIISLVALYRLVGVSVFIGMGWMVVVIVANPIIFYWQTKLEEVQQAKTDARVFKVTETISAMHVVKCYAWEEPATAMIETARRIEIRAMWRLYCLYIIMEVMWSSVLPITTAVMFLSFALLNPGSPLEPEMAFTAISLLNILNESIFELPWIVNTIVTGLVASKRIERLLFLPEADMPATLCLSSFCDTRADGSGHAAEDDDAGEACEAAVDFERASFCWPSQSDRDGGVGGHVEEDDEETVPAAEFHLSEMTFSIPRGALVAVVGPTASGKTSLLHAILGEMPRRLEEGSAPHGRVHVRRHRPIGFAPQQPWICNATVRENILYGEPYVEKRYKDCIRCCGLEADFAILQSGDQTKVGEKGIALSGGQKARVGLARAAYKHTSSLFLLDDPYSALDAHVAAQVHEEAVSKLLVGRTRVVVTNRLEFISSCDLIIVLDKGRIDAVGKYEQVRSSSEVLRTLLVAQGLETDAEGGRGDTEVEAAAPGETAPTALTRVVSGNSAATEDADSDREDNGAAAENDETYATGNIKKDIVYYYLKHLGSPATLVALAALYICSEGLQLLSPWWISQWTAAKPVGDDVWFYLQVYLWLSISSVAFSSVRDMSANFLGFRAAIKFHSNMWASVVRAPMSFFEETPHGRIINRFTSDTEEVDKELVWTVIYCVVPILGIVGSFVMVGISAWQALLLFSPISWLYYRTWKYYNKAAMDVKRISKVVSSPVYDHFNNLARENGVGLLRAHRQVERQCRINNHLIAEQQRPRYTQMYLECWFGMRMEHMGNLLVFVVAAFLVLLRGAVSPSMAALALMYAGLCSDELQGVMDQISEFGMAFNCVERIKEYSTTLPAEAPALTDRQPPADWPQAGELKVSNLRLRYREHLPLVLKGLTFNIGAGERLGIVGRTGAGKSSMILALLRIVEPEVGSSIILDGEDILALGLKDLRGRLAIIPQEPVLFQETLRYNCDPFGQYDDAKVWAALEEAQLAPWLREQGQSEQPGASATGAGSSIAEAPAGGSAAGVTSDSAPSAPELERLLRFQIKEGGQNLSAGQRQMVAIARAVLRRSKFVILDEATAAVDAATDAAIQLAIRRCFSGATTLTIAHRLKTILDSDRVMVLAEGEVVELDPPQELRERKGGVFAAMVGESEKS